MKTYIIPIFIPHYGCTHECVFCNQKKITGLSTPVTPERVEIILNEHLSNISFPRKVEVAYYGGSFTALPWEIQEKLLRPAYKAFKNGEIQGIRLSTRPDCINRDILEKLKSFGVTIIELGVQSMDNRVLSAADRGHDEKDCIQAVQLIKQAGIMCGIQLMLGLPKETWLILSKTAKKVIELAPDFTRIYPTLVLAETKLAQLYSQDCYQPLSLKEATLRAAFLKLLFQQNGISVIRTGLQATEELASSDTVLAGPYHPAFGELVDSHIFYIMIARTLENLFVPKGGTIVIYHNVRDTSKIRGLKNQNIKNLLREYSLKDIVCLQQEVREGQLIIQWNHLSFIINKKMLFSL